MLEERPIQVINLAEIMKKGEEDRISALPNCLLLEILSRLPSTKYAIRTGALSKRWEHLWTLVPTLIFSGNTEYFFIKGFDFGLMVDKTLSQCRQLKLKKFQVRAFNDIRLQSHFRKWIDFAISCNVQELKLECLEFWRIKGELVLDQFIFINSCFTHLTLEGCKLNPTGAISWENLKSLSISGVYLDEELLVKILSGSPLLETLVLEYCKRPHNMIGISAPTSLSFTQCRPLKKLKKFKLFTRFDIRFHPQINNSIRYAIICNVKELNLEFWGVRSGYELMIDQILFTSSCFTNLTLHGCKLNPVGAISWKSLRFLCISEYMNLDEDLIENILSGSPVLETLVLIYCYGYGRLDITSKSVKNLILCGLERPYDESEDDVIEINAPHILSLTIERGTFLCKLLLLNVSSLVKAFLNYKCTKYKHRQEEEQEMLKGFIRNLGHVKELEIGYLCAKALSSLQAQGFVSPSNVKVTRRI